MQGKVKKSHKTSIRFSLEGLVKVALIGMFLFFLLWEPPWHHLIFGPSVWKVASFFVPFFPCNPYSNPNCSRGKSETWENVSRITNPAVMFCGSAVLHTNSLLDSMKKQKRQMLSCLRCRKVLMMSAIFQLTFCKRSGELTTLGCESVSKRQGRAHDLHTCFFDLIYLCL